jgi:hypothetical protein
LELGELGVRPFADQVTQELHDEAASEPIRWWKRESARQRERRDEPRDAVQYGRHGHRRKNIARVAHLVSVYLYALTPGPPNTLPHPSCAEEGLFSGSLRFPRSQPSSGAHLTNSVPAKVAPRVWVAPSSSATATTPSKVRTSSTVSSRPGTSPRSPR